jgi:hypothetical protein
VDVAQATKATVARIVNRALMAFQSIIIVPGQKATSVCLTEIAGVHDKNLHTADFAQVFTENI